MVTTNGSDAGMAEGSTRAGGRRGRAILIAGPTASGKSALALALAARLGGAVINADSMQVYADLPILSAQPAADERAAAPHHLFGHVDGAAAFSVGRWLEDAEAALAHARVAGLTPIVVGGTGLYFKALTEGLSRMPAVPEAVRLRVRAAAEGVAPASLHARLAVVDPAAAARLRPSDPQRLLRALEIWEATGRSITVYQAERAAPVLRLADTVAIFLTSEREAVKTRIEERFATMMAAGALDEAGRLAARRLDDALPVMRALGVPPLLAHLAGTLTRAEAVATATRDTRAYARRQITFGRHQLPGFRPVVPDEAATVLLAALA